MKHSSGLTTEELEKALGTYYRALEPYQLGPRPADAGMFERVSQRRDLWPFLRVAASLGVVGSLLGVLLVPRFFGAVPVAAPIALSPASSAETGMQVDRAGLMRSGGIWATRGSQLFTSTDNGSTWQSGTFPVPGSTGVQPIVDVFVLDSQHAWSVSLALAVTSETPLTGLAKLSISRTTDGGRTWQQTDAPSQCTYNSEAFLRGHRTWLSRMRRCWHNRADRRWRCDVGRCGRLLKPRLCDRGQ